MPTTFTPNRSLDRYRADCYRENNFFVPKFYPPFILYQPYCIPINTYFASDARPLALGAQLALYGLVKLGCVYNFDYMIKLLQILRENRMEKGISQEYLAGKLGVSSSTISRWESKGNFPSTDKLFEYASFLDLSCYDVLALLANEQPKPVGRIEISAYNKATFNRLVNLLLKEGGNDIDFTKTHLM